MQASDKELELILKHALRLERHAWRIAEAHELGFEPGEYADIFRVEFQRRTRRVYNETLPMDYQRLVADSFELCARLMASAAHDGEVAEAWKTVAGYLRAVAEAIDEDPDCPPHQASFEVPDIGDFTPEVVHYERLAGLMHPDSVEELRAASAAVARYCRSSAQFAPDETQLACLQGLADGEKHAELAERLGYSRRHLQRILADMWHQFGVDNTIQGVAFAVAQGWITVPHSPVGPCLPG